MLELTHSLLDAEWLQEVAVEPNLAFLVFMQLCDHPQEFWWAPQFLENLPETAHSVKLFGDVNKLDVEPHVVVELAEVKYHAGNAPVGSEATLALGKVFITIVRISLFSKTPARILPAIESKVMPR